MEKVFHYRMPIERLLRTTDDLADLAAQAFAVIVDEDLFYVARYLVGPPVSTDDLRILADARLSPSSVRTDPASARRAVETVPCGLDRERFAWVAEQREPSIEERRIAVVATAALIASQRVRTGRQTDAPKREEELVKSPLAGADFIEGPPRPISNVLSAPQVGRFTGECVVGESQKADIVVRLWDGRVMPIECKVSNSQLTSIKRLTNGAAVKARIWIDDLGRINVVPVAVLCGVSGLRHLIEAQERGLTMFWTHSLEELLSFVSETEV